MTSKQICFHRAAWAWWLRQIEGLTFEEIKTVMKLRSKEEARRYAARGREL